jgi:hypothetical protein
MPGLRLVAELGGDGSGYDAMMRRANATKDKFSSAFSGLKNVVAGAFTVGAVSNLARKTIDLAGHLRDVSDALRVNVEWFQKRANAAKLAGGSEDDLFKFLDTVNRNRAEAVQNPKGEQAQAFQRLGLSTAEVATLNPAAFFDKLTGAFKNGLTGQAAADVEEVGGRSARNLLAAFQDQFQADVPVLSESLVNQLDEIGDEFTVLGQRLTVEFAPAVAAAANAVADAAGLLKQTKVGGEGFLAAFIAKFSSSDGFFKGIADGLEAGWNEMQRDIVSEANDQADRADQHAIAKDRMAEFRRKNEGAAPGFGPLEERGNRGKTMITDQLVGVGNFLGRNPAMVNTIANQQLQVARSHLTVAQQTLEALRNLKPMNDPGAGGILVPGT